MNRSAAEVKASLLEKLVQAAKADPKNPRIAAALKKLGGPVQASLDKEAISQETENFVRWALSTQTPMSPSEVEAFVTRTLNIKISKPEPKTGPRFKKGDTVEIKADSHKDHGSDIGPYKLYNGKIGTVVDTDGMDVLVAFQGVPAAVRFGNGLKDRGVGIYKYTEAYEVKGSGKIEMIYLADPTATPSADQKFLVEVYLGRGRGSEQRSANFYTGFIVFASVSKEGQFYFRGFPQQRIDPKSEGGYKPRSFNPTKGKVLYIGLDGKRPANWEDQLKKLDELMGAESK